MPTVTTALQDKVKLSPAILKKLRLKLATLKTLRAEVAVLEAKQDKVKEEIETLIIDADEFAALQAGMKIDDVSLKHVSGTTKRLDKKFMIAEGWVTQAQLDEATKEKPKKEYINIRFPGEKDHGGSDE